MAGNAGLPALVSMYNYCNDDTMTSKSVDWTNFEKQMEYIVGCSGMQDFLYFNEMNFERTV